MLHNGFQIDIRARLRFMQQHPTECAIGREGFLAQVSTWLLVAGVDPTDIERSFYPEKLSDMAFSLSLPIAGGDAEWPVQVVDKAIALLPDPCIVIAVRRPSGAS
jgi:hypothetical protein